MRLDVWQFMQDWVVRLRLRFLWSPFSVLVVVESERGRFDPAAVAGVADITDVAERMVESQEESPGVLIADPPLSGNWHRENRSKRRRSRTVRSCQRVQFGDATIMRQSVRTLSHSVIFERAGLRRSAVVSVGNHRFTISPVLCWSERV